MTQNDGDARHSNISQQELDSSNAVRRSSLDESGKHAVVTNEYSGKQKTIPSKSTQDASFTKPPAKEMVVKTEPYDLNNTPSSNIQPAEPSEQQYSTSNQMMDFDQYQGYEEEYDIQYSEENYDSSGQPLQEISAGI